MKKFDLQQWCSNWNEYKKTKKAKRHFVIIIAETVLFFAMLILSVWLS